MKMQPAKSFVAEAPVVDLSKPSLQALSYILRHQETWPPKFRWGYGNSRTCAIGLASALWSEIDLDCHRPIINCFGLAWDEYREIFCSDYGCECINVTPSMVADKIDAVLASRAGASALPGLAMAALGLELARIYPAPQSVEQ